MTTLYPFGDAQPVAALSVLYDAAARKQAAQSPISLDSPTRPADIDASVECLEQSEEENELSKNGNFESPGFGDAGMEIGLPLELAGLSGGDHVKRPMNAFMVGLILCCKV